MFSRICFSSVRVFLVFTHCGIYTYNFAFASAFLGFTSFAKRIRRIVGLVRFNDFAIFQFSFDIFYSIYPTLPANVKLLMVSCRVSLLARKVSNENSISLPFFFRICVKSSFYNCGQMETSDNKSEFFRSFSQYDFTVFHCEVVQNIA